MSFDMNKPLPVGKLDSDILCQLVFDEINYQREDVLVRCGIGEDCAVVDYGDYECVISTDPISAAVKDIGRLAINISCNDIASNGVEVVGITLVLMLPLGTTGEDIKSIMAQANKAAANLGVEIVGGHTEITTAVNQPVVVSTAFGKGIKGSSQKASNMKAGDLILMTKMAGMEGTGIICSDVPEKLDSFLSKEEISRGEAFLDKTSVVKEGILAGKIGTSGMHDVTEGGILGAIWEMCQIANLGAILYKDKIKVDPITLKISEYFGIDYLRLISSGAMIIVAAEEKAKKIISALDDADIDVAEIGRVEEIGQGIKIDLGKADDNLVEEVKPPEGDHLYKVI